MMRRSTTGPHIYLSNLLVLNAATQEEVHCGDYFAAAIGTVLDAAAQEEIRRAGDIVGAIDCPILMAKCRPLHPDMAVVTLLGTMCTSDFAPGNNFKQLEGGPKAPVSRMEWSPDGKELLTLSVDKKLTIWDADTWNVRATQPAPAQPLCAVFLESGGRIAVGCDDGMVRFFNPALEANGELKVSKAAITALVLDPAKQILVACDRDGTLFEIDAQQGQAKAEHATEYANIVDSRLDADANRLLLYAAPHRKGLSVLERQGLTGPPLGTLQDDRDQTIAFAIDFKPIENLKKMVPFIPEDGGSLVILRADDLSEIAVLENVPHVLLNAFGLSSVPTEVFDSPGWREVAPLQAEAMPGDTNLSWAERFDNWLKERGNTLIRPIEQTAR